MKKVKKIISFALGICFLLSAAATVYGAEEVPRVTFINEVSTSPDLYVRKQIESAVPGYEAPEDIEFTFILKLNKELANRVEYLVYDSNNNPVYNFNGVNKIPWTTDRFGTFALRAGYTAKFEYIGIGTSYEVMEMQKEQFTQIKPAGGSAAAGTIDADGEVAHFINLYTPPGTPGGKKCSLIIQKTVSFPEGYKVPKTPEFLFTVKLDGKPYRNEVYTVTDTATGSSVGTNSTDENGTFPLRGGQSAVFAEVAADVDYEVTEAETKGWQVTGSADREGTTSSPITYVNYNNISASFAVTKSMDDQSKPKVDFTFRLTHGDRSVWAGAEYHLYKTTGERVDEVDHQTDAKGQFVLRPGQTAIFNGIKSGTLYNVNEVGNPDYIQQIPSTAGGYEDKVVSESVEVLPFVNKKVQSAQELRVTKLVENAGDESPLAKDQFQFVLSRKDSPGSDSGYSPVTEAVYSIEAGTSQNTYKTDDQGGFILKADETARFQGLLGGEYRVTEKNLTSEYQPKDLILTNGGYSIDETLGADGCSFTFTNIFTAKTLDLHLTKSNQRGELLTGAEFMLYRDKELTNPVWTDSHVSDQNGKITMSDLKAGIYYLVETKAPEGYQLLPNPIVIRLIREGSHLQVEVDGKSYDSTDPKEQIYVKQNTDKNDEVYITVYNSKRFGLPITGGMGIVWIIIVGIIGLLVLFWNMHRIAKAGNYN